MNVRRVYGNGRWEDIPTRELIERGGRSDGGELERMAASITNLERIVAALIDRSGMRPDEVLEITGNQYEYEAKP